MFKKKLKEDAGVLATNHIPLMVNQFSRKTVSTLLQPVNALIKKAPVTNDSGKLCLLLLKTWAPSTVNLGGKNHAQQEAVRFHHSNLPL